MRDLFALSSDYDPTDKATQMFFAETQNKLLYAVTGKTAVEIIISRANTNKPNMALTSWKGSAVRKQDIFIAKNYLNEDEIDTLNRLVVIFLESAELRAKNRMDITMEFWHENVDRIIEFQDKNILRNAGSISNKQMEKGQIKPLKTGDLQLRKNDDFKLLFTYMPNMIKGEKNTKPWKPTSRI